MEDCISTAVRVGDGLSLFTHHDTGKVYMSDESEGGISRPVNRAEGHRLLERARAKILQEQARLAEEQVYLAEELKRCKFIEAALDEIMEQQAPSSYCRKLIPTGIV